MPQPFWGASHATASTCWTTASTNGSTCDGDGDGIVEVHGDDGGTTYSERWNFWVQLSSSGLIEGSYSGVSGPDGAWHAVIGDNSPQAKLSSAGWSTSYLYVANSGHSYQFPNNRKRNVLHFGAQQANGNMAGTVLTPEEAWNIDTKIDDGMPATGKAITFNNTSQPDCTNSATVEAEYELASNSIACSMVFDM